MQVMQVMQVMQFMQVMQVMQVIVTFARQVVSPARADPEACRQTDKKTTGDSYADPTR